MFTCGLLRSNFCFAMVSAPFVAGPLCGARKDTRAKYAAWAGKSSAVCLLSPASPLFLMSRHSEAVRAWCLTAETRQPLTATRAFAGGGAGYKAAQRRAAERRSCLRSIALYAGQIRERSKLCSSGSQIAVPWVRPGDARRADALDSAHLKAPECLQCPHS